MTYTVKNLQQAIGQKIKVRIEKWQIIMVVLDAKTAYGVPRVLVQPEHGEGQAWIDLSRVVMANTTEIAVY